MTRHELKEQLQHDHFTDAVSGVVVYARSHRENVIRWSIILGIVLILGGGAFWYAAYRNALRQQDLENAFAILEAPVGAPGQLGKTFPTQEAKTQASMKALQDVVTKDGGTRQGLIAQYYLGTLKAARQDTKGAETDLQAVANSSSECAPLAKIALAQIFAGANRVSEAQALLRDIISKPTDLVSKAQAEILLAHLDETSNPQEAKKLLQSLRAETDPAVSRAVQQISSQLNK
ncbi:MAG TPA: tetratricopeptide repeat protein [Bryobacteraceae bacterium]|nr:tetratricopeptide repeat protein [Bryobacteraceae bacterium]